MSNSSILYIDDADSAIKYTCSNGGVWVEKTGNSSSYAEGELSLRKRVKGRFGGKLTIIDFKELTTTPTLPTVPLLITSLVLESLYLGSATPTEESSRSLSTTASGFG